jgi:hypothetical protein
VCGGEEGSNLPSQRVWCAYFTSLACTAGDNFAER